MQMIKNMKLSKLFFVVFVALLAACSGSEYERLKKRELARNIRYDSLFLGLKFDMAKKDFYTHCWNLNKEGVINQGPSNLSVQYKLDSANLRTDAYMWFYPVFKDDKIIKMPIKFTYQAWAPWNAQLSSDSLLVDVKRMFVKWYGGSFILVSDNNNERKVWVKVDGNRRIRIFKENISTVRADITNLLEIDQEPSKTEESKP